ncbi:MAG: hypothetical protein JWP19_1905 [Rhodoglobus sp.]|nr:hypothetical protein [Rhodoglobus sp.]
MSLLGIDLGTSGVRAAAYSADGALLASAGVPITLDRGADGLATIDAEAVAAAVEAAIRTVVADPAVLADAVLAVSFSVLGEAVVPVDARGNALAPAPVSMDRRGMQAASDLGDRLGSDRVHSITGQPLHPMFSIYKIAAGGPGWSGAEVAGYRCMDGFVAERLGARPAIDYSMAARTGAFDVTTLAWSTEILSAVRDGGAEWVDARLLPQVVAPGSVIGAVSDSAAGRTGLAAGTLIVAGLHDQAASFVGAGGRAGTSSVFALGSSDCLTVATMGRPAGLGDTGFASYPIGEGLWITLAGTASGGWALEWFASLVGQDIATVFDVPAAHPPRLIVLPYFTGSGTLDNDTQARGVVAGLTLTTTREELSRGFLEASGFELAKILDAFASAGVDSGRIVAVGSGAANRAALDVRANAAGVELTADPGGTSARGAALLAGVGAGLYPGLSAVPAAEASTNTSTPAPTTRPWYDSQRAAYRELYRAMQPINKSLSHTEEKSQ